MGWTGGQLTGPATALNLIEFELGAAFRSRVIATHKKGGVVYAGVRHHAGDQVFALVLLVERRDGMVWTKAMTDPDGPAYHDCPTSILDLLTATDDAYASRWRRPCRDRAARPRPRTGQQVRFAESITFTDGTPARCSPSWAAPGLPARTAPTWPSRVGRRARTRSLTRTTTPPAHPPRRRWSVRHERP